jgi:hypothetical protein
MKIWCSSPPPQILAPFFLVDLYSTPLSVFEGSSPLAFGLRVILELFLSTSNLKVILVSL